MIKRDLYLNKLIAKKDNGMIKIITGIRRCGKSYLLFNLYYDYLLSIGIKDEQIIKIQLDDVKQLKYRNPFTLCDYVDAIVKGKKDTKFYLFIDEVQFIKRTKIDGVEDEAGIYEMLNGVNAYPNIDVYVTGSNSKMLSSDIATEFRGRGDEIRVHPLSFKEYYESLNTIDEKVNAYALYSRYGGMPYLTSLTDEQEKREYLIKLIDKVYIDDIVDRNKIRKDSAILGDLLNVIASSIGSLASPNKLANTFNSKQSLKLSHNTIANYLDYFVDSFLISKVKRYDIAGKAYIDTLCKYYFEDIGLRNARLGFKELDVTHIMESIIYNELILRGYNVNVGVIEHFMHEKDKSKRVNLEIDFAIDKNGKKYYIQSAYALDTKEKQEQEIRGFKKINDSFKKVVIVREKTLPWYDDSGIMYIGLENFLLDENCLES